MGEVPVKQNSRLHGDASIQKPWFRLILDRLNWPSLFAGAAIGMAGVHLAATRPLINEVRHLDARVSAVQSRVIELTGAQGDARASNSLLGSLIEQRDQAQAARVALSEIDALSNDVTVQSRRAAEAGEALAEISDVNSRLIASRDQRELTKIALSEIEILQQDIIALGSASTAGAAHVADADAVLARLADLNDRVAATSGRIDAACAALDGLQRVQDRMIVAAEQTPVAEQSAQRVIALQDTVAGIETLDAAADNADRLITLNDRIAATQNLDGAAANAEDLIALQDALVSDQRLHLEQAASNMDELLRLHAAIAGQTDQLADSIDALQLLTDFQGEFNGQVSHLEDLRRQMTELILLETTIARAMHALEPLAELGNLRRLDDDEVRAVARDILERRRERTAAGASKYEEPAPKIDSPAVEVLVPEPPTDE